MIGGENKKKNNLRNICLEGQDLLKGWDQIIELQNTPTSHYHATKGLFMEVSLYSTSYPAINKKKL